MDQHRLRLSFPHPSILLTALEGFLVDEGPLSRPYRPSNTNELFSYDEEYMSVQELSNREVQEKLPVLLLY